MMQFFKSCYGLNQNPKNRHATIETSRVRTGFNSIPSGLCVTA